MTKKSKKARLIVPDPDYKPFIVMNEYLQVWTGLRDGGRFLTFSNDINEAKTLNFDTQFVTLKELTSTKLEQIYI